MPLGEFSINGFGVLSDFWRKSQKGAKRKTGQKRPLRRSEGHPRRNEGHPRRGVALGSSEA